MSDTTNQYVAAIHDFRRARRRAKLRQILSQVAGESLSLLEYDEVRRRLHAVESSYRSLEDVPLDAIVGSVGRYQDFTREFLPKQDSDESRWASVRMAMTGMVGVPPVELYRIGDTYFVKDGNHRVSVARQLGAKSIQAYVTPVHARVPLEPDVGPEDLILKEEYTRFLEETRLDRLRPGADLSVTACGSYEVLLEHIRVHRYYMGIDEGREVAWEEAVGHWFDSVYLPVARSIRRQGLLRGFKGRTEADLYLWLAEHRARLERELGWDLSSTTIAEGLAGDRLSAEDRVRVLEEAVRARAQSGEGKGEGLAEDILVAVSGTPAGWSALEQALQLARREGSRLYGLQVVGGDGRREGAGVEAVRQEFEGRCLAAGVEGQFAVAVGRVVDQLVERAVWVDLVVASLRYPPAPSLAGRLTSGYLQLLRRSPRPVLAVPGLVTPLERPLLAFDGSARAREALFIAAYAAARWRLPLVVVTVLELGRVGARTLERARRYLEGYGVEAGYVEARGPVGQAIVDTAAAHECDVIIMGSYSYSRWLESVVGGVLDRVLREAGRPVLVV